MSGVVKPDQDGAASALGGGFVSTARLRAEPPVARSLRLLLVEDEDDDALLITRELQRGGYNPTITRVQTRDEFNAALDAHGWDAIVSDHTIPGYGGLLALADLQASGKDIPFILVSGTIGEQIAVSAMRAGARDYVLKGDLTRLPVAVEREVHQQAERAERTKIREQLVLSYRMASAGTLAAGIAHEINNPLAVAMGNFELVSEALARLPGTEGLLSLDEPLRDMGEALQRIRDIVKDVKLFSRPQDEKSGAVDIQQVIESSVRMAWNEIRHRARVIKDYRPIPQVNANESRLGQVMLNLIVNAVQAMPEGRIDSNLLRIATRTADDGGVIVEVADTGSGIAKIDLDRIFEPFFTTKAVGVGTGLGLSICHRIILDLGGTIEVETEVGKGTLFRVLLPAAADAPTATRPTLPPVSGRRARVLVVDDEPALTRVLDRALSKHHDVDAVTSARDALARIEAGERFDVIVSDLLMPEMTGMALYEEIHRIAPDQAERMVFMTGGAFTAAAREFLERVANPRIDKPIVATALLAVLADLLAPDVT